MSDAAFARLHLMLTSSPLLLLVFAHSFAAPSGDDLTTVSVVRAKKGPWRVLYLHLLNAFNFAFDWRSTRPKNRSDVLRFALDHSTPEGSGPLVSMVVDRTMLELRDGGKGRDNYSVLVSIQITRHDVTIPCVCWLQSSVICCLDLV